MRRQGFTLIELLVTTAIIGLLASIGSVSYSFVREKARDARRVADIRTIRNALETYFEQHGKYPDAPSGGIVLGEPRSEVISDAGITALGRENGLVYLGNVPSNVEPGGLPYLYTPQSPSGAGCTRGCPKFEIVFSLEGPIGEYVAGPHKMSDDGLKGPEGGYDDFEPPSFLESYVPSGSEVVERLSETVTNVDSARTVVAEAPGVQTASKALAPVAAVAVVANFAALIAGIAPLASGGQILFILLSQPLFILGRSRREGWGTVYDAGTKTPVDLASVRLIDAASGRPVATKVTDREGRYAFSPRRGTYRLEVVKQGYDFPAPSMKGIEDDGRFGKIYHGTLLEVANDGEPLTLNIPVERKQAVGDEVKRILSERNKRQLRGFIAASGPVLGLIVLVLVPSALMLLLFLTHLLIYFGFKWLSAPKEPKNQGIVHDSETEEPVARAVVRVFSLPYHKLLETKVTDAKGRYSFYVGKGKYYLTVTKQGYDKTETDEIDLTGVEKTTFIASDLPIRRSASGDANA